MLIFNPFKAAERAGRQPCASAQNRQFCAGKADRKGQHRQAARNRAAASQERTARAWRTEENHQPGICRSHYRARAIRQAGAQRNRSRTARPPLDRAAGTGKGGNLSHRRSRAGTHATRTERGQAANERRRQEAGNGGQQRRIGATAAAHDKRSAAGGEIRRHPDHQGRTGRGQRPRTGQRDHAGQTKHRRPPRRTAQNMPRGSGNRPAAPP